MSKQGFISEPVNRPSVPATVVNMPEVGELSRPPQSRPPVWVWVLLFVVAVVVVMVILFRSGSRTMGMGGMFIMPVMALSMLMMMRNRGGGNEKTKPAAIRQTRADFLHKLDELRDEVHEGGRAQAGEITYHHPNPAGLLTLVGTDRMWERHPNDRNFGHVRMGVGVSRLQMKIEPPTKVPPAEFRETVTAMAARDFLLTQNVIHGVPRPLHLFDQMGWAFFAEPDQRPLVQGVLRALVCQAAVFHPPDVLQVAVVTDDPRSWEWAKWLPHVADPQWVDASGPARLIFDEVAGLITHFGEELRGRAPWTPRMEGGATPDSWLLVVVDLPGGNCGPILGPSGRLGVSVLEATGDMDSLLQTAATAFVVDEAGDLLRARKEGR